VAIPKEIKEYYASGIEANRLDQDVFQLERARTQEIILRYLTGSPIRILDVGGGSGSYSFWLAEKGHEVHLVDPVQANIDEALKQQSQSGLRLSSLSIGEARALESEDNRFDLLLFLGPLYHLTDRRDRIAALKEARRVLKESGLLVCAAISRFASLFDGFFKGLNEDPGFTEIVRRDLESGQHRNTTGRICHFTTAFFHHPEELKEEILQAGFRLEKIFPIESFGGLLPDFCGLWEDQKSRDRLLEFICRIEDDPSLVGMTNHLLAVARKQ
jgi:ubiquinone/menaquinone biosynthesis C-methylase UbiE